MTNEQAWNFAIGIIQLDGIKPSDEFLELAERQKRGELYCQRNIPIEKCVMQVYDSVV